MRLTTFGVGITIGVAAACTSFGSNRVASEPDASVDASVAPPLLPVEGGVSSDAAARLIDCMKSHILCDDFESGTPSARWEVGSLLPIEGVERGKILVSEIPGGSDPERRASMKASLGPTAVTVAFSALVVDSGTNAPKNSRLVHVGYFEGGKDITVSVWASSGPKMQLNSQDQAGSHPGESFVPLGAGWHRFELRIVYGMNGAATLTVDGVAYPSPTPLVATPTGPQNATLELGLYAPNGETPILHVEYDDVVVDAIP